MRGPAFFAYADNYLVDVKFGVIVDVEATRAIRQAEVGASSIMPRHLDGISNRAFVKSALAQNDRNGVAQAVQRQTGFDLTGLFQPQAQRPPRSTPSTVHGCPSEFAHSVIASCSVASAKASRSGVEAGQKTGSPVLDLRVAISPLL